MAPEKQRSCAGRSGSAVMPGAREVRIDATGYGSREASGVLAREIRTTVLIKVQDSLTTLKIDSGFQLIPASQSECFSIDRVHTIILLWFTFATLRLRLLLRSMRLSHQDMWGESTTTTKSFDECIADQ